MGKTIMQIHLPSTPTVYINLEKHESRRNHIEAILKEQNFENVTRVNATYNPVGYIGLLESQLNAIENAKAPFLLLEDDVVIKDFQQEIQIPEEADAVYLGTSAWALQGKRTTHFLRYNKTEIPGLLRIRNMLSAHAILFVNEQFRLECIAALRKNLKEEQLPCDVILAKIQQKSLVYCLNQPVFVQGDFGEAMSDAPLWTGKSLRAYPKSLQVGQFGIPFNLPAIKLVLGMGPKK